jgi:hypothetical protein
MKPKTALAKKDLIVVLACIVFLLANIAAIGPRGRRHAKQMLCLSNLYKWGIIFQMYTRDNDGYFHGELGSSGSSQGWVPALRPYYGTPRIRLCPMAAKKFRSEGYFGPFTAWGIYPGETYDDYGSYGLNGWICNEEPEVSEWWVGAVNLWRTPNVKGAKNIPMFADCGWVDGWPQQTDDPPEFDGEIGTYFGNPMRQFCLNRHNGFINSAFLDFSARKVGLKELWTLKWHRQYDTCGPWTKCGGATPEVWPPWLRDFKDY